MNRFSFGAAGGGLSNINGPIRSVAYLLGNTSEAFRDGDLHSND